MHKTTIQGLLVATMLALALPALAETGTPASGKSAINNACIQTAVDAREQAISGIWSTFSTSMSNALAARKAALHDAWGMTDTKARRAAREAAWQTYRSANQAAHTALRTSRSSTWATFSTASKACGVPVVEARGLDSTGGIGL